MKKITTLKYDSNKNLKLSIKHEDYTINISSMFIQTDDSKWRYIWDIHVIVTRFGIGLFNINSCDEDYSFPYVYKHSPKAELKNLVNQVAMEAFKYAREYEHDIFCSNGVDGVYFN
jgi:hypothetical protein